LINPLFAMFGLGPTELLIVAAVVLLLFGTRLPKVMRSLGEGIVEFKRGVQGIEDTGSSGGRDAGRPDAR
jgi:sec-independent protein translocase protein TatA